MSWRKKILHKRKYSALKEKSKITPRQKEFAKIVAETGDIAAATMQVYGGNGRVLPSEVKDKAKEVLADPAVVAEIVKLWDEVGLTLPLAAQRHFQIMMDPLSKGSDVLRAVEDVYKGHKIPGFTPGDENIAPQKSPINIFIDQRNMRGLPIPKEIQEALKEEDAH